VKGYRTACGVLARQCIEERLAGFDLNSQAVFTCVLSPDAVKDVAALLPTAEKVIKDDPADYYLALVIHGAVLHRLGRHKEAVARLNEALQNRRPTRVVNPVGPDDRVEPASPALAWLFLAMAHHHLGDKDEARTWLDKAAAWIESPSKEKPHWWGWEQRLELQILRTEAEGLINQGKPREKR
jgi:tetratricopeptide (TPR) repeat protein